MFSCGHARMKNACKAGKQLTDSSTSCSYVITGRFYKKKLKSYERFRADTHVWKTLIKLENS